MNSVNGKTRNECFKTTSYSPTPAFGLPRIFHAIPLIRYKIETSTKAGPVAQRLEQRTHKPIFGQCQSPPRPAIARHFINLQILHIAARRQIQSQFDKPTATRTATEIMKCVLTMKPQQG